MPVSTLKIKVARTAVLVRTGTYILWSDRRENKKKAKEAHNRLSTYMSLCSQRCVHTSLPVSLVPVKMAITATAPAASPPLTASRNTV